MSIPLHRVAEQHLVVPFPRAGRCAGRTGRSFERRAVGDTPSRSGGLAGGDGCGTTRGVAQDPETAARTRSLGKTLGGPIRTAASFDAVGDDPVDLASRSCLIAPRVRISERNSRRTPGECRSACLRNQRGTSPFWRAEAQKILTLRW